MKKKCKWAGDTADEYCKSCDGIKMMVEGLEKSCTECAGYEAGNEEIEIELDDVHEDLPTETTETPVESEKTQVEQPKKEKATNTTPKKEKAVKTQNTKSSNVVKVAEEKEVKETTSQDGITIVALRYTSSATIKKGDNYYKFTAEEEWNTANYQGYIGDVREQLWATLNAEVDKQIEDLQNM